MIQQDVPTWALLLGELGGTTSAVLCAHVFPAAAQTRDACKEHENSEILSLDHRVN